MDTKTIEQLQQELTKNKISSFDIIEQSQLLKNALNDLQKELDTLSAQRNRILAQIKEINKSKE